MEEDETEVIGLAATPSLMCTGDEEKVEGFLEIQARVRKVPNNNITFLWKCLSNVPEAPGAGAL